MIREDIKTLSCKDGTSLLVRIWKPEHPTATVLIAHGHGEHSGRYEHVAQRLTAEGWTVIAPDHRGHGKSGGVRGHVLRWAEYAEDMELALQACADPKLPMALIGHSMGGLIAVDYALKNQAKMRALALSSPLLALAIPVPLVKAIAGKLLSSLLPSFTLPTALDPNAVSRDPAVVSAYLNDPLVHDRASTRWFTEMLAALAAATRRAGELQLPVLVFHAGADRLTDPQGSRVFFKELTTKERHFKEWQGLFHEIFNEKEQVQVLDELIAWMKPYLKA